MKQIFVVLIAVFALTNSAAADCNVFKNKAGAEITFSEQGDPIINGQKVVNGGAGTGIMIRVAHVGDDVVPYYWATAKLYADEGPIDILIWDREAYFPACD